VEAGLFLTPGDSRGYRGARFNRTRPARAVGDGGIGAVQVNLRYDYLDLNAGPITGGTQNGLFASLIWTTTAFTRFQINYGRLEYDDAAIALASGERDYSADTIGVRAEFDF
jgi:phosphate-selective porin OprO/OprP